MAALPTFPAFDLQAGDLSREWRKYVSRFENMQALVDPEITLEKLIQIAKSMELSEVQADGIESANQLTKKTGRREINQQRNESQSKSKCRFCGYHVGDILP